MATPERPASRARLGCLLGLGLALAMLLGAALSPMARAWLMMTVLLPELLDLPGPRPIVLVTGAPTRVEERLGGATLDVYAPAGPGPRGGLVMTLGVHPVDKRAPIVVRVAEGLARVGLAVAVVQSDALMADRIEPDEPANLVLAVEHLRAMPRVDPERVGLMGFSAGASIAFLAATDPRIADGVPALLWLGGYADAVELVGEVARREYQDRGVVVPWAPHELTSMVFRKQLVDALPDPADRAALAALGPAPSTAPARADGRPLGAEAQAVAALLTASEPSAIEAALDRLPRDLIARLRAVSPLDRAADVRARVYVLVDRGDALVPYVHSRRLANALPDGRLARYVELDLFEHVQPTRSLPPLILAGELAKLASVGAAFLRDLDPAR